MALSGKPSSRWGSLLSQAVAGVEARLDTMLADEESSAPKDSKTPPTANGNPASAKPASANRLNDRLQERLARAMAAKSAGQKPDVTSSRASTSSHGSPRVSIERAPRASSESAEPRHAELSGAEAAPHVLIESTAEQVTATPEPMEPSSSPTLPPPPPLPQSMSEHVHDRGVESATTLEKAQMQHQEEVHQYDERIDGLGAKLQYLARECSDVARKAVLAAPVDSMERKLAEKDEQICQLMEEGNNLASTEQKHRTIMKKLRAKIAEQDHELEALQDAKEKANKELETLRGRAMALAGLEKNHEELRKKYDQAQREVAALRPLGATKDSLIEELNLKLQRATEQAEAATSMANEKARDQDRRRITELEDQVAALEIERNLVADRAKAQANELQTKADRMSHYAQTLELELKAEVQAMESKLEAMRVRAEEASSGTIGDAQAKLLRQVETLQSQHAIASENWQGIENTLLARIALLERERDEAAQRESDMRKKAREAALRAKHTEEELEITKRRLADDRKLEAAQKDLDSVRIRAEEAEAAMSKLKTEFERQKQIWKEEKDERRSRPPSQPAFLERRGWLDEQLQSGLIRGEPHRRDSRPESPLLSPPQRTLSSDVLGPHGLSNRLARLPGPINGSDVGAAVFNRPLSRRTSAMQIQPSLVTAMPTTLPAVTDSAATSFTPHPLDRDRDDVFEGVETSSTSQQLLQDMVSVSTVAAGPSVQLVERMSAAIRRLESEKVATREELSRISKQRDEARAEIGVLIREAEASRSALRRASQLEGEVADMKARYETTLEMLGEKSELVEELRADVEDVKAMYRELVERTVP